MAKNHISSSVNPKNAAKKAARGAKPATYRKTKRTLRTFLEEIAAENRLPTFEEAVDFLGGETKPWLPRLMASWRQHLTFHRQLDRTDFSTAKQVAELKKIRSAMHRLSSNLFSMPGVILMPTQKAMSLAQQEVNKEIRRRTDSDGRARGGRGKFAQLSEKAAVAVLAAEVWHFTHKRYPAPSNPKMKAFTHILWLAYCRGQSDAGEPEAAWQNQLTQVEKRRENGEVASLIRWIRKDLVDADTGLRKRFSLFE